MSQFEWNTDVEEFEWEADTETVSWAKPFNVEDLPARESNNSPTYRFQLILTLVLLPIFIFLAYNRWQDYREREQILAVNEAVFMAQRELLLSADSANLTQLETHLSDRDIRWRNSKLFQIENSPDESDLTAFFSEPLLGLEATNIDAFIKGNVTLNQAFDSATITGDYVYETKEGDEIVLQRSYELALEDGEWQLQPPNRSYGTRLTGRYFGIYYGNEGREIVTRLHKDLNEIVIEVCDEFNITPCLGPVGLHSDPDTLPVVAETFAGLFLPDPAVFGMPKDEAGYELLLDIYTDRLVPFILEREHFYRCCYHRAFVRAITTNYHNPPEIDYAAPHIASLTLQDAGMFWNEFGYEYLADADHEAIHATVAFLRSRNPDMLSDLPNEYDLFEEWVLEVGEFMVWGEAEEGFKSFISGQ